MNTADVYKILYIILGFYAVIVSYWLAAGALFPALTRRANDNYGAHPTKTFLIGLLTLGPIQLLGWGLTRVPNPAVKIVGAIILLLSLLCAFIGSAGLALRIGEGLKAEIDERSPWCQNLRGSLVLGLTFNLPLLGWFVVLPATLISGFGAFVLSRRAPALEPATPPQVSIPEPPAIPEIR